MENRCIPADGHASESKRPVAAEWAPFVRFFSIRTWLVHHPMIDVATMHWWGLAERAARFDHTSPGTHLLSAGERQRIAFTRLIVERPNIIILDEATLAPDEGANHLLWHSSAKLRAATLVSVGHRPGLDAFPDRGITML